MAVQSCPSLLALVCIVVAYLANFGIAGQRTRRASYMSSNLKIRTTLTITREELRPK